ncbi:MAG: hypothetical protein RL637_1522 [Pseudomonadota bacterium]|jgi:hypothetical protein
MSETQKLIISIIGAIAVGFIMVGMNKEQSPEQIEAASMIRNVVAMQEMAGQKCPKVIKEYTGDQLYFPSDTETDKSTYVTLKWNGEKGDHFKKATCTLHVTLGGISKLVIDDKVLIDKQP